MAMLMERGAAAGQYPALMRVRTELEAFKRKFYLNLLVRGLLVAGGALVLDALAPAGTHARITLPLVSLAVR